MNANSLIRLSFSHKVKCYDVKNEIKVILIFHRTRNWTHFIVPQANSLKKPVFVFLRQPCLFTESFPVARMATTHFIHVTVDQNGVQMFKLLTSNNTYFGKREV